MINLAPNEAFHWQDDAGRWTLQHARSGTHEHLTACGKRIPGHANIDTRRQPDADTCRRCRGFLRTPESITETMARNAECDAAFNARVGDAVRVREGVRVHRVKPYIGMRATVVAVRGERPYTTLVVTVDHDGQTLQLRPYQAVLEGSR
jgi:hypothetical protein